MKCRTPSEVVDSINKALTIQGKLTNLGVSVDCCMIMSALKKKGKLIFLGNKFTDFIMCDGAFICVLQFPDLFLA